MDTKTRTPVKPLYMSPRTVASSPVLYVSEALSCSSKKRKKQNGCSAKLKHASVATLLPNCLAGRIEAKVCVLVKH
jgi:hypothetical protein